MKYGWEEENNDVEETSDDSRIVGGLSGDGVPTNQSLIDPSLAAIKLMPLQRNGLIRKATGISPHVMLLSSMQKVLNAQHVFLLNMKQVINEEFDKREVVHSTFQVQKQVQDMLTSF